MFAVVSGATLLATPQAESAGPGSVFELSGEVQGPMRGCQRNPAGAWNGEVFLVVWDDERGMDKDIFGMRLDAAGQPLDPGGFQITDRDGIQRFPAVSAMADGKFLVAWEDRATGNLMANVVTRDGSVGYGEGIIIAAPPNRCRDIALVDSLAGILAVWVEHASGGSQLRGRILDRSTGLPDPDYPARRLTDQSAVQEPAVASYGGAFYVTWEDDGADELFGGLIDPKQWGGDFAEPSSLGHFSNAGGDAEVVGGVDGFVVAWIRQFRDQLQPSDPSDRLFVEVAEIAADGVVSSRVSSASLLLDGDYTTRVSLALAPLEGERFLIAWQHECLDSTSVLRGLEYVAGGGLSGEPSALADRFRSAHDPHLVTGKGRTLLVWEDLRFDHAVDGNEEICARFSPRGGFSGLGDEMLLTAATDSPRRTPLATASDGDGFFTLWRSESDTIAGGVFGAHVSADGSLTPPSGHLIASGAVSADIASDGDGYLIVWQGGQHLGWTAVPSDPAEFDQIQSRSIRYQPGPPGASVAVASDGSSYVGVSTLSVYGGNQSHLNIFTTSDETNLQELIPSTLETLAGAANEVEITGAGGQYAVFWSEPISADGISDITMQRVRRGRLGGVEPIAARSVVVEGGVTLRPGLGLRAVSGEEGHRYYWMDGELGVRSRAVGLDGVIEADETVESYRGEVGLPRSPAMAHDGVDCWFVSGWVAGGGARLRVSRQYGTEVFRDPECVLEFGAAPNGFSVAHDGTGLLLVTAFDGDPRMVGYRIALERPQLRIEKTRSGYRLELSGTPLRRYLRQESTDLLGWSDGVEWETDAGGTASVEIPQSGDAPRGYHRATSDFK